MSVLIFPFKSLLFKSPGPISVADTESFSDSGGASYSFTSTISAPGTRWYVAMAAAREGSMDSKSDPPPSINLTVDFNSSNRISAGKNLGSGSEALGINMMARPGPLTTPTIRFDGPDSDNSADQGAAVAVVLKNVNGVEDTATYDTGSSTSRTLTVNTVDGGAVVAMASIGDSGSSFSWSGATEIYDYSVGGIRMSAAVRTGLSAGTHSVTASSGGSGNPWCMAVMSFN